MLVDLKDFLTLLKSLTDNFNERSYERAPI